MAQRSFNSLEPLDQATQPSSARNGPAVHPHPLGQRQTIYGPVSPDALGSTGTPEQPTAPAFVPDKRIKS